MLSENKLSLLPPECVSVTITDVSVVTLCISLISPISTLNSPNARSRLVFAPHPVSGSGHWTLYRSCLTFSRGLNANAQRKRKFIQSWTLYFYECNHFLLSDGISSVCSSVKSWPGSEIWRKEFNFVVSLQGAALKHFPRGLELEGSGASQLCGADGLWCVMPPGYFASWELLGI